METDRVVSEEPERSGRRTRWSRQAARRLATNPRFGLAVRAAVAAAISWGFVQVLPGFAADYPYYAPLGAVIATSTTIAGAAQQSAQTVTAIALGAAVALGIESLLGRNLATMAAVVGIGVLLGGWKRLGSGAAWLPTSGLFVLVLGNEHPLHYVAGFAGLTLLGALIGLVLITAFPPLPLAPASAALDRLRTTLADQLEDLVAGLRQGGAPTPGEWDAHVHAIDPVVAQAREAVSRAAEARRGNRIAGRFRDSLERQRRQAEALQRLAFLVASITQFLTEADVAGRERMALGPSLRLPVAEALGSLAPLLRSVDGQEPDPVAAERACDALRTLTAQLRRTRATTDEDLLVASGIVENIRRSLRTLRPPGADEPAVG
ncbi:aromatic acid exporter family protein [Geodermatophilus sp. SYSU D00758]